jgi:dCMP deaminase
METKLKHLEFIQAAKQYARENHTVRHIHAVVLVKDGRIIGRGSIGGGVHGEVDPDTGQKHGCDREHLNVPTGTRYDLCDGCGNEYHSEPSAIRDARSHGEDTTDADMYFWGHWWCCEPCWNAMIAAGIRDVYLMEGSERLFNKAHPDNVIGRQFE